MAKRFTGAVYKHEPSYNKTNIGRKPSVAKMNKHKRRSYKVYRGQGKSR